LTNPNQKRHQAIKGIYKMKNKFLKAAFVGFFLTVSSFAYSSLVKIGGTGTSGAGNIIYSGGGTLSDVSNSAYDNSVTTPASGWVWDGITGIASYYTFTFSLAGFDISTANLSGLWGVDNVGSASLNGNLISDLPNFLHSNFSSLKAFAIGGSSGFFNTNANILTFEVTDLGAPGAFRASVQVTANAIPEPSIPAILGLGLMFLAYRRFNL
jgi:hypothetical protein